MLRAALGEFQSKQIKHLHYKEKKEEKKSESGGAIERVKSHHHPTSCII
jgi:hypothetical protein